MRDKRGIIDTIAASIAENGPMPVADYMRQCLGHYYAGGEAIGRKGDFTTAPEISQMFGEIIGAWALQQAAGLGTAPIHLVELGPGRGTLMADMLRLFRLKPATAEQLQVHLVETSPSLRETQGQKLSNWAVTWHDTIDTLPQGRLIVIANEFFDALPIRQFIVEKGQWRERAVMLAEDRFALTSLAPHRLPTDLPEPEPDGAIIEHHGAGQAIASSLAARIGQHGGAMLVVDYGYAGPATGDTLQAVRRHGFADPLEAPGLADLTTHVDFTQLAHATIGSGCRFAGPITQAEFLTALGIAERARQLSAGTPAAAPAIETDLARLISPDAMGALFKVMTIWRAGQPPPPPFA